MKLRAEYVSTELSVNFLCRSIFSCLREINLITISAEELTLSLLKNKVTQAFSQKKIVQRNINKTSFIDEYMCL